MIEDKKMFKKLMIFLCLLVSCTSIKKSDTLVVGISPDFPPFAMKVNGELAGSDVEMMKRIGVALKKKIEFKEMDFDSLIPALLARKIDMALSGVSMTQERKKKVLFSKPYYSEKLCLLFNKTKNHFAKICDLQDKTVATYLGTTYQAMVEKSFSKYKIYKNGFQALDELRIGRVDGFIVGETQCVEYVKQFKNLSFFKLPDEYNIESSFAIAMRKEDQELAHQVDQVIAHVL